MPHRSVTAVSSLTALAALASTLALAACPSTDFTGGTGKPTGVSGGTTATIRFVNALETTLELTVNDLVPAGGATAGFGGASGCLAVGATTPTIAARAPGTETPLALLSPTLVAGLRYTLVAAPGVAGNQLLLIPDDHTPAAGQAGFRVVNATAGTTGFDVFVTAPGATLGTPVAAGVAAGGASAFVDVPAGTREVRLTAAGTGTLVLDAGSLAFAAGRRTTLVVAPPAAGSTALRTITVTGC